MNSSPNITFIICTYNRAAYLDDTLDSLMKQTFGEECVEILVINNNSSDDTSEIVNKYQNKASGTAFTISYHEEEQQGLSYARNRGIKEAASDNIVFVDDDIKADQGFISSWLRFFNDHQEYNAAGGKISVQFDDHRPKWASHFLLSLFGHHNLGNKVKEYPRGKYPFGGNMAFRKKLLEKTGTFNVDLGRKGKVLTANEEKDLFNRIRQHGERILYIPGAALHHRIGRERATRDYIRKQAEGMGKSIAVQVRNSPQDILKHVFKELVKSGVSLFLLLLYLLRFAPSKGIMLLKFRYWILRGYLSAGEEV